MPGQRGRVQGELASVTAPDASERALRGRPSPGFGRRVHVRCMRHTVSIRVARLPVGSPCEADPHVCGAGAGCACGRPLN